MILSRYRFQVIVTKRDTPSRIQRNVPRRPPPYFNVNNRFLNCDLGKFQKPMFQYT
jgi:hypothetical protein